MSLVLHPLYRCYLVVAFCFVLCLLGFYPGGMTYDSYLFFTQSLSSNYKFHNSPIIAFAWHWLNYLSRGPFIMLLLEQIMLWGAVLIFTNSWYKKHGYSRELWVFVLVPLLPAILKTSGYIWKDVLFGLSYLLLAAIFSYYILQKKRPCLLVKAILPIMIFFGTACKFQAIYIAPIFIFWYLLVCYNLSKKMLFIVTLVLSFLMSGSIKYTNSFLANDYNETSRVGWQEIKFFDLVYISLKQDKILLPDYIKNFAESLFHQQFSILCMVGYLSLLLQKIWVNKRK